MNRKTRILTRFVFDCWLCAQKIWCLRLANEEELVLRAKTIISYAKDKKVKCSQNRCQRGDLCERSHGSRESEKVRF